MIITEHPLADHESEYAIENRDDSYDGLQYASADRFTAYTIESDNGAIFFTSTVADRIYPVQE